MILTNKISFLSAMIALSVPMAVVGHGYMKTPRSRNYHANLNGKFSGGTSSDPEKVKLEHSNPQRQINTTLASLIKCTFPSKRKLALIAST